MVVTYIQFLNKNPVDSTERLFRERLRVRLPLPVRQVKAEILEAWVLVKIKEL